MAEPARTRLTLTDDGPVLIEGPVEIVLLDGTTAVSDRPVVALCTCRRSRSYPFCDTSHRRKARRALPAAAGNIPEPTESGPGT